MAVQIRIIVETITKNGRNVLFFPSQSTKTWHNLHTVESSSCDCTLQIFILTNDKWKTLEAYLDVWQLGMDDCNDYFVE